MQAFALDASRRGAGWVAVRLRTRILLAILLTLLAIDVLGTAVYPAVIAALVGNTPGPLRTWSSEVANLQGTSVTVTDGSGNVVSRGHAPDQVGDNLSTRLVGLQMALNGQKASGVESGDEHGAALRGYVPVHQDGLTGPIVGAVMIADPTPPLPARRATRSARSVALSRTCATASLTSPPACGTSATFWTPCSARPAPAS